MNVNPSTPSWRPSAPIPRRIGVYRARRSVSYTTIYVFFAFLVLLAIAFTVYLFLTGGQHYGAK
jgi:hypothetical protein